MEKTVSEHSVKLNLLSSSQHKEQEQTDSKLCAFHSNSLISELTCSCHTAWSLLQIHSCPHISITQVTGRSAALSGSKQKTEVICRYLLNTHFSHSIKDQEKGAGKRETKPILNQLLNLQPLLSTPLHTQEQYKDAMLTVSGGQIKRGSTHLHGQILK